MDKTDGSELEDMLPEGVGLRITHADGAIEDHIDPFLLKMQFANVTVHSSTFAGLARSDQLFEMAFAYLAASRTLTIEIGRQGEVSQPLSWSHAEVAIYCLHHAVELFLKACLLRRASTQPKDIHDIHELLEEYRKCFVGPEYEFVISLALRPTAIRDEAGNPAFVRGLDTKPDIRSRYWMDRAGNQTEWTHMFSPGYKLNEIGHLEEKWRSIRDLLPDKSQSCEP